MTNVEPPDGELQLVPLPPVLKRRLQYVAAVYVGLFSLLLTIFWAQGSSMVPWLVAIVLPLLLAAYISRNATVAVRVPSSEAPLEATRIDSAFEGTASPFTARIVGLIAVLAVAMGVTAVIVIQMPLESPGLVEARAACGLSWEQFEQNQTTETQRSWTECLIRNPPLVAECRIGAQLSNAMLDVDSIAEVSVELSDLMACGDSLY